MVFAQVMSSCSLNVPLLPPSTQPWSSSHSNTEYTDPLHPHTRQGGQHMRREYGDVPDTEANKKWNSEKREKSTVCSVAPQGRVHEYIILACKGGPLIFLRGCAENSREKQTVSGIK